jgi:hypothetical protein
VSLLALKDRSDSQGRNDGGDHFTHLILPVNYHNHQSRIPLHLELVGSLSKSATGFRPPRATHFSALQPHQHPSPWRNLRDPSCITEVRRPELQAAWDRSPHIRRNASVNGSFAAAEPRQQPDRSGRVTCSRPLAVRSITR